MKYLIVLVALLAAGCGGSTTAPTPAPIVPAPTPTPPPVVSMITVSACPEAVPGLDLGFYREIGCNAFDLPLQAVRRWASAPKLYLRTVDEAGAPIDAVTLDTVQNAMIAAAPQLTAGHLAVSVERGPRSMEGQSGYVTVKFPVVDSGTVCGHAPVAVDGGWIELNYKVPSCSCFGVFRKQIAAHELGHALGYWHTDGPHDLMAGAAVAEFACEAVLSAREQQAVAYQYR